MELLKQLDKFDSVSDSARSRVYDLVLKHFQRHPESPWSGKYLVELEKTIKAFYASVNQEYQEVFRDTLPDVMKQFYDRAVKEIKTAGVYKNLIGDSDPARVSHFLESSFKQVAMRTDKMSFDHIQALRQLSAEVFRETSVTGATRKEVSKRLLERALEIKGFQFTDKGGNKWPNKSYFQMLARTELMNAGRASYDDKMAGEGFDIMKLTTSGDSCDHCAKFEGKPFSLTGATPGIPTKQDLIDAGVFHPNCTHSYSLIPAYIAREKYGIKDAKTQAELEREKAEETSRKSKEGKALKKKGFIPAKTMDEAQKRLYEITGSDVTLNEGTSLEAANAVLKKYQKITDKFPQFKGEFGRILDPPKNFGGREYAHAGEGRHPSLSINPRMFGEDMRVKLLYEKDVKTGFHPRRTSWESVFTHEIGHQISTMASIKKYYDPSSGIPLWLQERELEKKFCQEVKRRTLKKAGLRAGNVREVLSDYASENSQEFFAEAFAEYMDSPNPRPISKAFGEVIEEMLNEVYRQ